MTWADLAGLPKIPNEVETTSTIKTRAGLEALWKPSGKKQPPKIKAISNPQSLRATLRISQPRFGQLVADYLQRSQPFTGSTVSTWEYAYRSRSPKVWAKYRPTTAVAEACRAIVEDLVALSSEGRLRVKTKMNKRVWSFDLVANCRDCGRPFTLKTARSVKCHYCAKKGK
jgi:hypothetical protein